MKLLTVALVMLLLAAAAATANRCCNSSFHSSGFVVHLWWMGVCAKVAAAFALQNRTNARSFGVMSCVS